MSGLATPGATGPATRLRERQRAAKIALVPVLVLLGVVLLIRVLSLEEVPWIQNVLLIFSGLLVEALPFILLGAIVSAGIEMFLPDSAFSRLAGVPKPVQVGASAFGGMLFPVCECGSVPVARRLMMRGLTPTAATTFMLAAPIVNPIVILSTIFAFQGRSILWLMVIGRVVLGIIVAVSAGLIAGPAALQGRLAAVDAEAAEGHEHTHDHDHGHDHDHSGEGSKTGAFFGHLAADFTFMARFMMIGALIAALIQTAIPPNMIEEVAASVILSILAMMALAFALSLCSESDAILISSFVQFSPSSQLAFLVFGPMLDTKLVVLYGGTFGRRFLRLLIPVVGIVTFIGCLWVEALYRIW